MELKDVCNLIFNSECSLFLGAGSSVSGGGPSGLNLALDVRKKFPYVQEENDFFKIFDEAIKSDNSQRAAVEQYVRSLLMTVRPTYNHKYLFSLPWNAVLTTNYDHIPDSLLSTLDENRSIITITDPKDEIKFTREDQLYCFKLFGDMSKNYPEKGSMVLTNSDRRRAYIIQSKYFNMFKALAKSGTFIYLGYSFVDDLVFEILEDLTYEISGFTHKGYAIIPDEPNPDVIKKMDKYNIEWVKGGLNDFILEAKKRFEDIPVSFSITYSPIKIMGVTIDISRETYSNIRGKLKLVSQLDFDDRISSPNKFIEGKDKTLVPYREGWNYPRKLKVLHCDNKIDAQLFNNTNNFIISRCLTGNPVDNIKIALIARAGSGKTVIGNKIAYEWYQKGNPVIYLNSNNHFIDPYAIEGLLDEIWTKYQGSKKTQEELSPIRYLIICDNASLLVGQIDQLYNRLMSTGKPADILIIDRQSTLTETYLKGKQYNAILTINDTIKNDEIIDFVSHFQKHNLISDMTTLKLNLENEAINNSFFALVYTSIQEARKTLKEIIIDEYNKLNNDLKKIYEYVALIESFGINPYRTIISQISDKNFPILKQLIKEGNLNGIINFDEENASLYTNHRVIADIIKEHVFSKKANLKYGISRIITSTTSGIYEEMNLLHNLLISSNEIKINFNNKELQELFKLAIDKIQTRPLYHHLAKIQLNEGNINDCEENLYKAKNIYNPEFPEREQNIIDTYGRLELAKARKTPDEELKWQHLQSAAEFFKDAQTNPFDSPHPYLGLAQIYSEMSKFQQEYNLKMDLCIASLKNINDVIRNAPDDFDLDQIYYLQKEIFDNLSKMKFDEENAQYIFEITNNINGYAYLAEKNINDPNTSINYVNKGLSLDNSSIWLIRIKTQILKQHYPENIEEYNKTLSLFEKIKNSSFDLFLLYELAKMTFKQERWEESKDLFKELKGYVTNYKYRLIPRAGDRWIEKNISKKLIGEISECPYKSNWGQIKSLEPAIPYLILLPRKQILFRPCVPKKRVSFEIIFNMTGPQASNVNEK